MDRLTKRTTYGHAYLAITEGWPKEATAIEASYELLAGLMDVFEKLAEYEDDEERKLKQISQAPTETRKPSWDEAPEWAEYLAMSPNGGWYWFEQCPSVATIEGDEYDWDYDSQVNGRYDDASFNKDWRCSLECRPKEASKCTTE